MDDITFESVAERKRRNKLDRIESWEAFDKERLRKIVNITAMERKLEKARENLDQWSEQVVDHLKATIGGRGKQ